MTRAASPCVDPIVTLPSDPPHDVPPLKPHSPKGMCWPTLRPSRACARATASGRSRSGRVSSATPRSGARCAPATSSTGRGWRAGRRAARPCEGRLQSGAARTWCALCCESEGHETVFFHDPRQCLTLCVSRFVRRHPNARLKAAGRAQPARVIQGWGAGKWCDAQGSMGGPARATVGRAQMAIPAAPRMRGARTCIVLVRGSCSPQAGKQVLPPCVPAAPEIFQAQGLRSFVVLPGSRP